jgi:aspartyl aminopeptidase
MSRKAAREFLDFVDASPSPFHAVETCSKRLISSGFTEISEADKWVCTSNITGSIETRRKTLLYSQ